MDFIYGSNQNNMSIGFIYNLLILSEADRLGLIDHENYKQMLKGLLDSLIKSVCPDNTTY